jgi:HAMP domain-containing protein
MSSGTVRFIRNATAVAVTAAIGFSLIAAVVFVRPLLRVGSMVAALTAGDMGAKVLRSGNDEVGDLGRALNHMAMALRRKLLDAGLGEALISQLVETLPCPCVVFAEAGDVVAINGPGRRALRIEGSLAGQHMREFAEHAAVQEAVAAAELEGEPEPLHVTLADRFAVRGFLHVLKRPGTAPLRVFFGAELPEAEPMLLPEPSHIAPRPLADVLELALQRCTGEIQRSGLHLELPIPRPNLIVADADDRMVIAVRKTLLACAQLLAGTSTVLRVALLEETTQIGLHLDLELPADAAAAVRPLIEPLGGSLEVALLETNLWLPRA